ncbi:unnamed protein product [Nyctereutes procyonoides]|uniref:(raccoon dog) hypothetical protein n=1 Tax=Nyctereutes procyonoides TaxID=34880 RepID=A0A811ZPP8_NYCPR|nr:unnamed protein product [Nyctereutes procyonoides]
MESQSVGLEVFKYLQLKLRFDSSVLGTGEQGPSGVNSDYIRSSNMHSFGETGNTLAVYVYEYLRHVGAQKSAQTFLSEIRWDKNITLGEPPGFLHSRWCVFWELYCAAPERRDTCEHSSEAKAFHDCRGVPGTQRLLPNSMDPTRQQGHGPMGPGPQNYGSRMRPPPNSLAGRPWPNPNSANSTPYSSSSPGTYVGPPGGGGPPGTPIMPSPADSTNSSDNIYTMINPVPPGGNWSNFPMGPGSHGRMGGMGSMEPHHMKGSLGSGDIDGLPKNSSNNINDGDLGENFLHSFQNDNFSPSMRMSV